MKRASVLALLGLILLSNSLAGQSLFGSQGLGMPTEPLNARARGLGSVGVGLLGPTLSPTDLAAAAKILIPSVQFSLQPHWVDGELGDASVNTRGTRFPHIGVSYPVRWLQGVAVFHIGTYMDQRWELQESFVQEFRGVSVPVNDSFESDGGVSTFQLGWAQRLGDDLSLGVGIGARMGSVVRRFTRTIEAEGAFQVVPYRSSGEWQYFGVLASAGFQWDPVEFFRLGGSVVRSGDLEAEPTGGTEGQKVDFDLPTEYRVGASGILTPRLAVTAGFSFSDWSPSNDVLDPGSVAGSVWSVGGGLEWTGPTLGVRNFPVRFGLRRSGLPFTFEGKNPTEQVVSGGVGANLLPPSAGMMGAVDLAIERGTRDAGSLSESFWRATLTFRAGGF